MNNTKVVTFDFDEMPVRVLDHAGEPWFVLIDVCRVLAIANPRDAATRLDDDEKNTVVISDGNRGNPNTNIISESGMFTLILRSHDALKSGTTAHRFRKWVTGEVLPAIRRTGKYVHQTVAADFDDEPETGPDVVAAMGADQARVWLDIVREARRLAGAPAGLAVWRKSPLPQFPMVAAEEQDNSRIHDVRQFMDNRTEQADGARVQASILYGEYCTWAVEANRAAVSNKAFAKNLLAMGVARVERAQGRFWLDRRLAQV